MEIKKQLVIKSPPSKVFKAITDPQQLTQWFPDVASIDPKIGGKISFKISKPHGGSTMQDRLVEGRILELEKNKKLAYTWEFPDREELQPMQVVWNLEEMGIGMTRVTITHRGLADKKLMGTYSDGWSWLMERLNAFAAPAKPVNMGHQIVSSFVPGMHLLAFYRIGKLQKSLLYVLLPTMALAGALHVSNAAFQAYVDVNPKNPAPAEVYLIAALLMFLMLASVLAVLAITNYFMHKWSEEWNRKFLQT